MKNKILKYCIGLVCILASCTPYEKPERPLSLSKSQFYGNWYFKSLQKSTWHYDFISEYLCYRYEKPGPVTVQYKYKLWYVKGDSLHLVNDSKYEKQTFRIHSISENQIVWSAENQIDTLIKK